MASAGPTMFFASRKVSHPQAELKYTVYMFFLFTVAVSFMMLILLLLPLMLLILLLLLYVYVYVHGLCSMVHGVRVWLCLCMVFVARHKNYAYINACCPKNRC